MKEFQFWKVNARLARVLPLVRDEAALSRLVQHVHPDAPENQVHLLVDDLRTLIERDLADLTAAFLAVRTELRAITIAFHERHVCLACGSECDINEHATVRRSANTVHPRTGRFMLDGPPIQVIKPGESRASTEDSSR